jgi:signal transduction histidine kinase
VIEAVVASLATQMRQRGLNLTVNVPADLPPIAGDRGRLVQILLNLLGNAVLYTNPGGAIGVDVRVVDSAIAVAVSDSGIGISPDDVGKVFDRFYRGESSRVQECQGTGLGLAIVKSFVEMHGGRIWVASELGKGSTFTFTLPCSRRHEG